MKAFLECEFGEFFDEYVYNTYYHILNRGIEPIKFNYIDNKSNNILFENGFIIDVKGIKHKIEKSDIIIGCVESYIEFYKHLGIYMPNYIGYPIELRGFLNRNVFTSKISDVIGNNYFIKPLNNIKEFTGFVMHDKLTLDKLKLYYNNIDLNTDIWVSDIININSEWRCFVHNDKLIGVFNYDGNFRTYPDMGVIDKMIGEYSKNNDRPVAYTLDVGIDYTNNSTFLIEVNDFWALGSYGLDGRLYLNAHLDRIYQIKKDQGSL